MRLKAEYFVETFVSGILRFENLVRPQNLSDGVRLRRLNLSILMFLITQWSRLSGRLAHTHHSLDYLPPQHRTQTAHRRQQRETQTCSWYSAVQAKDDSSEHQVHR